MPSSIFLEEQAIWIVIALFYISDTIKPLRGNRMVLLETWKLGWRAEMPSEAMVFLNRKIVVLNLLLPYCMAIPLYWFTESAAQPASIRRADRTLRVARRRVAALRVLSGVSFLAFFVEGPLLTYVRGLNFALIQIAPVYLCMLLLLLWSLLADRRFWGLHRWQVATMVAEVAVCPGYLVNIARRMSWRYIRLDVDGGAYGLLRSSPTNADRLRSALDFALEELEQRLDDSSGARDRIISYRQSLCR